MCLLNFRLDYYYAKILDLIYIVQRVFTYPVGRWQTFSAVEGCHYIFGGIEGHLICARPFMERVNIGLKEKSVRTIVDWSVQ